ncbi:MAG TPA: ABC transporter substrate-binding protein [Acidimicrobiia bacterium]
MGTRCGASRLGALALGLSLVAACAPTAAGPELPRPPQPQILTSSTTASPSTTTTLDERTLLARGCPTEVCLLYRISPEARWSDGEPVTADDFAATVRAHKDPLAGGRNPVYDLVTEVEAIDPKTARVALSEPRGAWQSLFDRLIPAHVETLDPRSMPTTGPFVFEQWVPGDRIVVERNRDWWSEIDPLAKASLGPIERIEFVFIADTEELLDSIESGEVDVAALRPSDEIVERLTDFDQTVRYTLSPGPFWEHIDFHHEDELLSQDWVREVIDLAIDRQEILDQTVRLLSPSAGALDNTIWMQNTAHYEPHYEDRYDPEAAEQLLIDEGCVLEDEVYRCGGRPMSFVWISTNDDPDRREIVEAVSEDLAAVGINIVPNLRTPSAFVTRDILFGGPDVWQIANFSWRVGSDPSTADATYFCGDSDMNVNRYCSPEVEELVKAAGTIMDPVSRSAAFNQADSLYLADRALIPLYQKPDLLAWAAELDGPTPNFSKSTEMWNVAAWTGSTSVVVALPAEPTALDPLSTTDESANRVLATMLYGAFGMDPSLNHVPVLVDSVDVLQR